MLIFTVFVLALIDLTVQTDLFEGSLCQLHTGESGICKNSLNCKWLIKNLSRKNMSFGDIRRCTFTSLNEEVVCCKDDQPDNQFTENPTKLPCELGYLFDFNCVSPVEDPSLHPLPVPDVTNQTKFCSGCKTKAACQTYQQYATELSIFSIINGEPALPTEFPHMVALGYLNSRNGYDFDCGGALIADKWIVTAAHCIKDKRKPVIVRMGKLDLHEDDGYIAIDRTILRTVRHPQYSNSRKKNDIALVEFDGGVDFNGDVHPACIQTDTNDIPENVEMTISGWGSIEADRTNRSKILLKAAVFTVPLDTCNQTLVEFNQLSNQPSLRGLTPSQMCALNRKTKSDACQGDSGGPLFIRDESGMSTIHGIVSFGVSCGTELPGVYTRIASYTDWIESIVWP